jgi:hypothetical protein
MKKRYEKPAIESESVFETLASGCTFISAGDDSNCNPDFGGVELQSA